MNRWHLLAIPVLAVAGMILAGPASDLIAQNESPPDAARPAGQPPRAAVARSAASGQIDVSSVLVTLIEERDVPAQEAGVLAMVAVKEGDSVEEGQVLARIDDAEAQLEKRRTEIELDIARRKAGNDIAVRFAKASHAVADNEYQRSLDAKRRNSSAVSDSQLDRDRLAAQEATLQVEQAEHNFQIEQLTAQLKENEFAVATRGVERRRILSPIAGVVVEVVSRPGEWVVPAERVFRILRIDRLRVEGFLNGAEVGEDLTGRRAVLTVNLPGQPGAAFEGSVVFVSPELNPVNGEIRFFAEVENRGRKLRPGMRAELTIYDAPAVTAR